MAEQTEDLLNPTLDLPPDAMDFAIGEEFEEAAQEAPAEELEAAAPEPEPEAEEPAPEPVTPDFSDKFAEIARKEAALLAERQQLQASQAEVASLVEVRDLLKSDKHLDALAKMGVTYDDLTKKFIAGEGPDREDTLRAELQRQREELEAKIEEVRRPQIEQREQEERSRVAAALAEDDNFPLLQAVSGADRIFDRVKSHYSETGQIISYVDAAKVVESELRAVVDALRASPRAAEFLVAPASAPEAEAPEETPNESSGNDVTLSNELEAAKKVVVDDGFDPSTASDEEMIERLASQLRFS